MKFFITIKQILEKLLLQLDTASLIKLKLNTNAESADVAMISKNLNVLHFGQRCLRKRKRALQRSQH